MNKCLYPYLYLNLYLTFSVGYIYCIVDSRNSRNLWVIILIGITRAGKTTLSKIPHHRLEDKYKIALIHYDTIFEMKTGKDKESLKPIIALWMIENFLIENYNLILDNSFIFTQYLRQTIQLIEKYTSKYRIYFLRPSFLEIVERDKKFPVPKRH